MLSDLTVLRFSATADTYSTDNHAIDKQRIATGNERDAQHKSVTVTAVCSRQTAVTTGNDEADVYAQSFTFSRTTAHSLPTSSSDKNSRSFVCAILDVINRTTSNPIIYTE